MAGYGQLKVSPDVMKNQAKAITGEIRKIETEWKKMEEVITRSKYYWQGEASNIHQKSYHKVKMEVEKVIRRLNEHPTDLLEMAGVYIKAESEAVQFANVLPDDVIV